MDFQEKKAEIITKYLIGRAPTRMNKDLFNQALKKLNVTAGRNDRQIWDLVLNHPFLLPYIDAGFALIEPKNTIRQKLYIMFAVLETDPLYSDLFIYKKRGFWIVSVFWFGLRALFRAIAGFFIVALMRRSEQLKS